MYPISEIHKNLSIGLKVEYVSTEFSAFLSDKGLIHQKSCPHIPQQNGIVERKNRYILETVSTLLVESLVPPQFWCEAYH